MYSKLNPYFMFKSYSILTHHNKLRNTTSIKSIQLLNLIIRFRRTRLN